MPTGCRYATCVASAFLCVLATAAFSLGQAPSKGSERLAELKFTGLNHFSSEQLSAAIGVHVGDRVTSERLKDAAAFLAKSGAFDDVNFRYASEAGSLTAEFRVVETNRLLPCLFDNFVWFANEQIDQTLRKRVPFYAGVIPESGATGEQVRIALRDMVRANGIQADVEKIGHAQSIGQPVARFDFRVTGVSMPIRGATFPGASAIAESNLKAASKDLVGQEFSVSLVNTFVSAGLLPIYQRRGYLRARFAEPQAKWTGDSSAPRHLEITLTVPVSEGSEFLWGRAEWNGNHLFSSDDLDQLLGMKPREVANQEKIEAGLATIATAYQKHGFVDAAVRDQMILEDANHMASSKITIDEGEQYRMGKVVFTGLTERAAKQLTNGWKLKPGEIYDGTYTAEFIQKVAPAALLKNGVKNMRTSMKLEREKENAVVNLYIVFR